jgi:hypothetical protein
MSTTPVSVTVIKANTPRLMKDGTLRTTFVSISVNILSGHISIHETHSPSEAEEHFKDRGDPPYWRGLQIIRVDA